jgi:hypothetical protein
MSNVLHPSSKVLVINTLASKKAATNNGLFIHFLAQRFLSTVNRRLLYFLSISLFSTLFLNQTTLLAQQQMTVPKAEMPVEVLEFKRQIFLVTEHTVFIVEKKGLRPVFQSENLIKAAAATKNMFCLATNSGLLTAQPTSLIENLTFTKRQLPTDKTDFIALFKDPSAEQIWVGTRDNGIYIINDSTEKLMIKALFVNDLAIVSPNDYWIGTDAGLVHRVAGETIRYAEEGVAGFEIPDNIVEKLHIINGEKLVVQMSDPLSIFHLAAEKTSAHGINLGFIGKKGNRVFDLKGLPDGAVLAATAAGLTHLPKHILADDHEHQGFHEIFSEADRREATKIDLADLGFKTEATSIVIKKIFFDSRHNIWLAADGQLGHIKVKKLFQLLKQQK